jgi:hypothetical protein
LGKLPIENMERFLARIEEIENEIISQENNFAF